MEEDEPFEKEDNPLRKRTSLLFFPSLLSVLSRLPSPAVRFWQTHPVCFKAARVLQAPRIVSTKRRRGGPGPLSTTTHAFLHPLSQPPSPPSRNDASSRAHTQCAPDHRPPQAGCSGIFANCLSSEMFNVCARQSCRARYHLQDLSPPLLTALPAITSNRVALGRRASAADAGTSASSK